MNNTTLTQGDLNNLDKWIAQLYECKPISEAEVKTLCEKVLNSVSFYRVGAGNRR